MISPWQNGGMARKKNQPWFLKEWREHRGLTQERLGELAGRSKAYISQLENGSRAYTQETLEKLAAALECKPGDLLLWAPDPNIPAPATQRAKIRA